MMVITVTASVATLVLGALVTLLTQPVPRRRSAPAPAPVEPERLRQHVVQLACELGPRSHEHPQNLDRVATYIIDALRDVGVPAAEQAYANGRYRNVVATLGPADSRLPRVVVGAHYDTHGPLPGADDNASGVAALLELGRLLGASRLRSPVELVAYTLEEQPHAMTPMMGSVVHASSLREAKVPVKAMLALEMLGYYRDEPGSQRFPAPWLRLLYPSRGNFVAVVGRWGEFALARRIKAAMRGAAPLPVVSLNAPRWIQGVEQSDHVSYWNRGYPAVMITDTAYLRNPNYHTRYDTPETLDYRRMAQAVTQVYAAVIDLQSRA